MMTSFDLEYANTLQLLEAFEASLSTFTRDSTAWRDDEPATTPNQQEAPEEHLGADEPEGQEQDSDECPICFERVPVPDMVVLRPCSHRFCQRCLLQYVEVQMNAKRVPVRCPQDCPQQLDLDQCRPFLDPGTLEALGRCLAEACIPESEKYYCPFSDCSALMSRNKSALVGECECMECHRLFCIGCRVPWHAGKSCGQFRRLLPEERNKEDAQLRNLARLKKWQHCKKCKSVISLYRGCNHITCRCGHEFCYVCGAAWRNNSATCKCNLWDENNIRF